MSNTLTRMVPDLYEAMDVVSRELVGLIPAVTLDARSSRAAVNQEVVIHMAPAAAASDITPGVTAPNDGDQTIGNTTLKITKARAVPFRWNGEEQLGVNSGPGYSRIRLDQMMQAMRTLTNEVESDLAGLHSTFSRAFGTAGTTPFASDLEDSAQVRKILKDNGAPEGDNHLVIDTTAGVKLLKMAQLTKSNEAGTSDLRSQGILLPLHGMSLRESAQIKTFTKGTGASATTNNAGYAIGATTITLASAGTGTILAGDVITFAGDTNKYVVESGDADVSGGGTITLAAPGLRQAIAASATAITVVNTSARNMAFHRSALVLAARAPAIPEEGDMADDRMLITDPRSGLTFEVSMYKQYRQVRYELALAWGVKNIKPAHTALLLG